MGIDLNLTGGLCAESTSFDRDVHFHILPL